MKLFSICRSALTRLLWSMSQASSTSSGEKARRFKLWCMETNEYRFTVLELTLTHQVASNALQEDCTALDTASNQEAALCDALC